MLSAQELKTQKIIESRKLREENVAISLEINEYLKQIDLYEKEREQIQNNIIELYNKKQKNADEREKMFAKCRISEEKENIKPIQPLGDFQGFYNPNNSLEKNQNYDLEKTLNKKLCPT